MKHQWIETNGKLINSGGFGFIIPSIIVTATLDLQDNRDATGEKRLTNTVSRCFLALYVFVFPSFNFCHIACLSCPGDEG